MTLNDKVAFVTGGSRGIGRVIALELAKAGATVCFNYQSSEDKARKVLDELKSVSNKNHQMLKCDVSKVEDVERSVKACLDSCQSIDILVNNAGITRDNLLLRMKESEWDDVMNVNLKGVFNFSKAVSKGMLKKRQGRIINISSLSGVMGNPGQTNYSASKAGVIGFTKSLAKELAKRNILVNAITPGFIETEMSSQLPEAQRKTICDQIPQGHFGSCEDIAHLVVFLASDKAKYITGQVFGVNGGLYM